MKKGGYSDKPTSRDAGEAGMWAYCLFNISAWCPLQGILGHPLPRIPANLLSQAIPEKPMEKKEEAMEPTTKKMISLQKERDLQTPIEPLAQNSGR